jgi:hypothetical protein
MTQNELRKLLKKVWAQKVPVDEAMKAIKLAPLEDLTYARVDHHRGVRCGFPEVIFCEGKRLDDLTAIARSILERSGLLLATRADGRAFEAIKAVSPRAVYHERARCVTVRGEGKAAEIAAGRILIVSAGTADVPVAEEARVTAEMIGHEVETIYDAGVAGIHRLLGKAERLHDADVIIVVAGMEGALASVVGGLADCPVIAVPTSVGYGASFGGIAPLLTMLNSCAAGVGVVNIDNGFGAGYLAALIARRGGRE